MSRPSQIDRVGQAIADSQLVLLSLGERQWSYEEITTRNEDGWELVTSAPLGNELHTTVTLTPPELARAWRASRAILAEQLGGPVPED